MKNLYMLIAMVLLGQSVVAQQPQLEWAKSIGGVSHDGGLSIALDNAGNVFTAGYFMETVVINPGPDSVQLVSVGGSADILISKHDKDGNFLWAKGMGGPNSDGAYVCAVDGDGNVFLTGYFMDVVDFDPGPGVFEMTSVYEYDFFVCKLDSFGNFLWAKQVGGTGDYDMGQNMILDPKDGSILITGVFNGTSDFDPGSGIFSLTANAYDVYVLKLDADGNFIWAAQIGGDGWDFGMGISLDEEGSIFLCGEFESTADFNPGAGTFYMTSSGYADGFVCKLDDEGRFNWAVQMGNIGQDWANSLDVDPSGNVLITGEFLWDFDFDPGAGEYILTSQAWDAFVWKLDTDGNFVWARKLGGTDFDWGNYITVDDLGNAYTTGYFMTTADFDPGDEVFNLEAGAYYEVYISKLTESGDFAWAVAFEGNMFYDVNINQGWGIAIDEEYNVYSTGYFESWTDVDPGPDIFYLTAADAGNGWYSEDAYIHKMKQEPVGLKDNSEETHFSCYPNPVSNFLTIELGKEYNFIQADIIDLTGKTLASERFQKASTITLTLDVIPGIYMVQLKNSEGKVENLKVIKE